MGRRGSVNVQERGKWMEIGTRSTVVAVLRMMTGGATTNCGNGGGNGGKRTGSHHGDRSHQMRRRVVAVIVGIIGADYANVLIRSNINALFM
jgi:hypothetical protein